MPTADWARDNPGLLKAGATVLMACRSRRKGSSPLATAGTGPLALTCSTWILHLGVEAADEVQSRCGRLDLLINNAG